MSSFVMKASDLSFIARAIVRLCATSRGDSFRELLVACSAHSVSYTSTEEDLFGQLLAFNVDRVRVRYPDDKCAYDYEYVSGLPDISYCQELKLMDCFMYQCAEGPDYYNNHVYMLVEKSAGALRDLIVSQLPEYKQAYWDEVPVGAVASAVAAPAEHFHRSLW